MTNPETKCSKMHNLLTKPVKPVELLLLMSADGQETDVVMTELD
jgi:hypothetical protein